MFSSLHHYSSISLYMPSIGLILVLPLGESKTESDKTSIYIFRVWFEIMGNQLRFNFRWIFRSIGASYQRIVTRKNRYYDYEINDRYILTPKGIFVAQDSNDSNNWVQLSCIISDNRYGTWLHVSHYEFMHGAACFITDPDEPKRQIRSTVPFKNRSSCSIIIQFTMWPCILALFPSSALSFNNGCFYHYCFKV